MSNVNFAKYYHDSHVVETWNDEDEKEECCFSSDEGARKYVESLVALGVEVETLHLHTWLTEVDGQPGVKVRSQEWRVQ